MCNADAVDESAEQRDGRRNKAAGRKDQAHEEDILAHYESLAGGTRTGPSNNVNRRLETLIASTCLMWKACVEKVARRARVRSCERRQPGLAAQVRSRTPARSCGQCGDRLRQPPSVSVARVPWR